MSTIPHAIQPSHEGPFPQPSPQRSVKDVLITPCKGCHETEHTPACARLLSSTNSASARPLIDAGSRLFGFFHNFASATEGCSPTAGGPARRRRARPERSRGGCALRHSQIILS